MTVARTSMALAAKGKISPFPNPWISLRPIFSFFAFRSSDEHVGLVYENIIHAYQTTALLQGMYLFSFGVVYELRLAS